MTKVAALFVSTKGPYWNRPDVDAWDLERDARTYTGPYPVVAHPPCFLWVNLAAVNWKRYRRQMPAWYPGGTDDGCFASAVESVQAYGGVLEHPASTHAWHKWITHRPYGPGWQRATNIANDWHCEVWQSAYGHKARKRTWLYYVGASKPPDLAWSRQPGTHQVGWFDRKKPTLSKSEAIKSPPAFAEVLINLARSSRMERAA
jgi:hypothetical protein